MGTGVRIVSILCLMFAVLPSDALAAPIVEQRFNLPSNVNPHFLYGNGHDSFVFAPFELTTDSHRVEQVLWWGTSPSSDFTIRFHDSIVREDGRFIPDLVPRVEINVTASSRIVEPHTNLFWADLSEPVFLPIGVQYLSIVGEEFFWHTSDGVETNLMTLVLRSFGFLQILVDGHHDAAFVLNDTIDPIPEPTSAILVTFGLAALSMRRNRAGMEALRASDSITSPS